MSSSLVPLEKTPDKQSAADLDAKVECDSPRGKVGHDKSRMENACAFVSPLGHNNQKSSPRYYSYAYPHALPSSPHPSPTGPYIFTTAMGYNQAYCLHSPVTEYSEDFAAVQQDSSDFPNTAATPLSNNVPVTFIQGPAPAFAQVHSPSKKSIWNGSPYVGQGPLNLAVSPPNTPLSHTQPIQFQYMGGGNLQNLSFDSLSIGQGMDDIPSSSLTFDGSCMLPWGNSHEADICSVSSHFMPPPQHVMVTSNPHLTACQQFYSWPSPGPPIQMMPSSKGPEGANLFVFHIPNHFTNTDLWNLFRPYGNVVSVRIMVEKDTGRSRGFGFVSYDLPESAALAIKHLNGYAIGHKRLKVQPKQSRSLEQSQAYEYSSSLSCNQQELHEDFDGSREENK